MNDVEAYDHWCQMLHGRESDRRDRRTPELAWAVIASRPLAGIRVAIANAVENIAPWHARPRFTFRVRRTVAIGEAR